MLFERVLTLADHSQNELRSEALYVLANSITSANLEHLKILFDRHSSALLEPLCRSLDKGHMPELIVTILQALIKLLSLDDEYKQTMFGCDSVQFLMESVQGFDKVESLVQHKN